MQKALLLVGALMLSCSSVSLPQSASSSWSKLSALQPGQAVQVATTSKKYSGTLIRVSDTSVVLRDASSEESIQRTDIRSVKAVKARQRTKRAIIGAAVGAGSGAAVGAAAGGCSGSCFLGPARGELAGIGAGLGAAVGAAIGAAMPSHSTTVYKAGTR